MNHPARIFTIVKAHIDALDPIGLLSSGAPKDEYALESEAISRNITEDSSAGDISGVIASVFHHYFDIPENAESFLATAERIHVDLTNQL